MISNTWKHIRRSPYQAFAAVSIMILTILVSGIFLLLTVGSAVVLSYFEQKPQIVVFFKDAKKEADIKKLVAKLSDSDKVANVKYISKEEALTIYTDQFKSDPLLLEMVSADILPASIEVSAVKIEYLSDLARNLKNESDIEEIVYQEDVVNLLLSWTSAFRQIGLILVLFLSFVALLTVVTVISMKIALRREEIEILQLIGATAWYIRLPFLMEGMFYGLLGATIATSINIGTVIYATPFLQQLLTGIPVFPIPHWSFGVFILGNLTTGIILGLFASMLAVNRYIR